MEKENFREKEKEPTLEQLAKEFKEMEKTIKNLEDRINEIEEKSGNNRIYADHSGIVITKKERKGNIEDLH